MQRYEIWLGSLAHYNAGHLYGQWVSLPMDEEELKALVSKYTNGGQHDFYIADYSLPFEVGEYTDPLQINRIVEEYTGLDEWQQEAFDYLVDCENFSLSEALAKVDEVIVHDCDSFKDLAMDLVSEDMLLGTVPSLLANYFDYEAYGRDLSFSGQFTLHRGKIFEYA